MLKTPLAVLTLVSFLVTGIVGPMPAYAQEYRLPAPGVMVHLSPEFTPPILKGIKVHPDNPFRFDFILDKGDSQLSNDALKDESRKLIKYFLASLTIPEKDLWVNLSPYEKDRIIPQSFGLTEMGRDLLAEDYMLKQITASLIYPDDEIGKKFWKRIYEEAAKRFGTTNMPVNTFNKVWIVPEKAVVYENAKAGTAYVVESKLKVMLEQDYLSLEKHEGIQTKQAQTNQLGSQVVREIVIPELIKEVNEDKNFAKLRQVYNSLILATWYKKKIKDSILSQVYTDKNKVAGVNINDPQEKERIYQKYLRAFKKGVFNYIKEESDPITQQVIPRKYFSGGFDFAQLTQEHFGISPVFQTIHDQNQVPVEGSLDNTVLVEENTISATQVRGSIVTPSNDAGRGVIPPIVPPTIVDRASLSTGKVGKMIPGTPLKSQNEYNRDADRKEKFLKSQDVVNRFIAPGREGFEKFQPLYDEVRSIIDRLLIAQGLDPKEFQFFLADTVDPNAYVVNYYNTIVVNVGLIRMLAEYARANNIPVTQDALAWVLSHEILHIMQNRREIDEGRFDEKKGLIDRHAEDRGKEYQSDLLALWLMDRGGFTVKTAPQILQGIDHWLAVRGQRDGIWGTHPQIEERLRQLEHQILTFHWQNQDAQATALKSVALSQQRTRFREFQEQAVNVKTATELISLLSQAKTIEELHFGMLIGFEVLPGTEKQAQSQVQAAFEEQIRQFAGENEAKKVLYEYTRDEVYVMLGLMRDDLSARLDSFKRLGEQLSVETILQIYELGVPDIFSLSLDVDKLQRNKRHEQAQGILERLNTYSITMGGPTRASDRFKSYASGFLYGFYTRMIKDARQGALSLSQARRFLTDLVNMQDSQGYFKGYLFTTPLSEMASALTLSKVYRGQLTPEDIKLLIHVYEILGTKVNYALKPDSIAKDFYEMAKDVSPETKQELMDWLLRRDDGWNALRAEFIKLDIQSLFNGGQSIISEGTKTEYLKNLLANNNIVKNMKDVLKAFVEAVHSRANNISAEDLVIMHQMIFNKFKEKHINADLGIFRDLWLTTRHTSGMFDGDAFDRVLSENLPEELRPLLNNMRRELKPAFYIIALGGIPEEKNLRDFIFGAIRVRERENENFFSNIQVQQMINSLPLKRGAPKNLTTAEERYRFLEYDDLQKVHELYDQLNPEHRIENVNNNEFGLFKALLEYYRQPMGQLLADKDSTPEQQEEAFGRYAAPIYLQTLFVELGYDMRLREDDVGYASSAWDLFAGDISRKGVSEESKLAELAVKQRPRNAVRYMSENITFEDFVRLFNFISLLPQNYEEAVDIVVKKMPPSVFRNFVLHMIFVNRALVNDTGYASDNDSLFDYSKMQEHIAGLPLEQRGQVLSAIAAIVPHLVQDSDTEKSNQLAIADYWRERNSSKAPKLDETAIRQEHDEEIGSYNDMMYSVPGGPIAQLYIFFSRLADSEVKRAIESDELSLSAKRETIEKYYPQSSPARDRWIKAAIQSEGKDKTVEEIEKLLAMIYNRDLRDNLALGAFDQYRSEHPNEFGSLTDVLGKIQRFFPEASLIRDDVLSETAQYLAKTDPQYATARALYLDPFKKTKDLDLKETARTAMNADVFRSWMKNRSATEKARFLLWLMGITDEKPFFLVDFEYNFHVNADSMREDFGRRQSKYYPLAGQSSQREALEPFLYGEKGVFNDGTAMSSLLDGMFDFLIKEGANKNVLKKVFDKVFEKADQTRREEIFMALVWTLSLQRGELSNQQNISPERQEARAVRMFLESLGLVGRQLAQVLARSLWVTQTMRDELSLVQDNARKMDKGVVFDMLKKFGLLDQFESIDEPLGSAKVAGVYRAKMRDGRIVAIKVKRPEVDKTIEADMKFLKDVFDDDLKAAFMAEGIVIPGNFITQIEEGFRQELDFKQEAKNTKDLGDHVQRSLLKRIKEFSLRKLFGDTRLGEVQGDYEFYVPQILGVVNNSLIIMEYIDGVKLSSEKRVEEAGLNQSDIELAVANELLREVFYEGFYHGDPHLGNILIQKGENGKVRIILIDAGASFSINKTNRRMLGKLMVAVRDNQSDVLESIIQQLGGTLNDEMRQELADQVLGSKDSVGQKLLWFFHILEKNNVQMPNELLQIMRFFATGQALFGRGDSAMINPAEKEPAVILDQMINQAPDEVTKRGGIDLTPANMNLQTQNAGEEIKFHLDPAMLQQLQNAPGFVPVIISIQPMGNLRAFLGLNETNALSVNS